VIVTLAGLKSGNAALMGGGGAADDESVPGFQCSPSIFKNSGFGA
jgi:hypothetical protein